MQELFIFSGSILTLFAISFAVSYKFQKDFSSLSKTSGILVIMAALMIILLTVLFVFLLLGVFNIGISSNFKAFLLDQNKNDISTTKQGTSMLTTMLVITNLFFFLIIPFVFFYFLEEKNLKYQSSNEFDNENDNENDVLLGRHQGNTNINSSPYYSDESPLNSNMLKNYFYYLTALSCSNLIYFILFKINYFSSEKSLMRYSVVPDELRKASHFYSVYEILTYANFGVLIIIGQVLFLVYVPYGAGKLLSSLVENLKGGDNIKKEYTNLNSNFSKNYETIKHITSQKLMTGRPLSKKEKMILKSCKETDTILQHKQEILEEKLSTFQIFLNYLTIPLKFLIIFSCLIFFVFFCLSLGMLIYSQLEKSPCGVDCAFVTSPGESNSVTLQKILFSFKQNNAVLILTLSKMLAFLLTASITGIKNLGIVNILPFIRSYSVSDVKSSKVLSLILYTIFSFVTLISILQIFSILPDIKFFKHSSDNWGCDILHMNSDIIVGGANISPRNCTISDFGSFYLKIYMNFPIFKYAEMIFSVCLTILISTLIIYLPIKSITGKLSSDSENNGTPNTE